MSRRRKWLVTLAVGALAGALHVVHVRSLERELGGGEAVEVLAAATRIEPGDRVVAGRLATRRIPAAYVDGRAVRAEDAAEVEGVAATVSLETGQVFQWTDFAPRAGAGEEDLAERIESGMRGITIPVDGALSMGGLLRPGHRVDILGTFSRGAKWSSAERVTFTLLQNVLVLATGRDLKGEEAESGKGRFRTATLSVGLEESELLALASQQGELSLVLRGRLDLETVRDVPEKGMDDIWEAEKRNELQQKPRRRPAAGIERLTPR